jgi:organic radical activating enzyme
MTKITLDYVEFYITNVCNFNCTHCNRFNNYQFSGQQKWDDYKDIYREWSNKLDLPRVSILGGEPTLNPTFMDWVNGVRELWPETSIEITTNGTRFKFWPELYQTIIDHRKKGGQTFISIGVHNKDRKDEMIQEIKESLQKPITESYISWGEEVDPTVPLAEGRFIDLKLVDANWVTVVVQDNWYFADSALREKDGVFTLYENNGSRAHELCYNRDSHHFIKGKLYKCGVAGLLPEFTDQFQFDLTKKQQELVHSYAPLEVDNTEQEMQTFIANIKNVIPQCSLCPVEFDTYEISASTIKQKIKKNAKV